MSIPPGWILLGAGALVAFYVGAVLYLAARLLRLDSGAERRRERRDY